jgi:hypothetical protein
MVSTSEAQSSISWYILHSDLLMSLSYLSYRSASALKIYSTPSVRGRYARIRVEEQRKASQEVKFPSMKSPVVPRFHKLTRYSICSCSSCRFDDCVTLSSTDVPSWVLEKGVAV